MKWLILFASCFTVFFVKAQTDSSTKKQAFPLTFDINISRAQFNELPPGIRESFFSLDYSIYFQYKIPVIKKILTLLPGAGVSWQDLRFNGKISYSPNLDTTYITPLAANSYETNKMSFCYAEAPIDLRFTPGRRREQGITITAGFSTGIEVEDFVKTTGEDKNGNRTKVRVYYTDNLERYRYGVRAKIGYDGFCLFGYYNLPTLFEKNMGPAITYWSAGVSLGGF